MVLTKNVPSLIWDFLRKVSWGISYGEAGTLAGYVDILHHLKFIDEAGKIDIALNIKPIEMKLNLGFLVCTYLISNSIKIV